MRIFIKHLTAVTILFSLFLLQSCMSYKGALYMNDLKDSLGVKNSAVFPIATYEKVLLRPNDQLYIEITTIGSTDKLNSNSYDIGQPYTSGASKDDGTLYVINDSGYVKLPQIGSVFLKGLSISQATEIIEQEASKYYNSPIVNVRIANFKVTVLGEVAKPGQYIMPSDKNSLIDAIGVSGDITIYGSKKDVLLMRIENGVSKFVKFDLTKTDFLKSNYFYLKQGDIIYVQPVKAKVASSDASQVRTISIITSLSTVVIVLITRINF